MSNYWWEGPPRRLIQTNLNERDIAAFHLDNYLRSLEEFSADTVIFNTGGIIANYPTKLPWHYHNPYNTEDILPGLIKELHKRDIKIIARFDMSKINSELAETYKTSLCINRKGEYLNYNDQVQVCVNSPYQQKLAPEILREALSLYTFDGIFFNMPGYLTKDYSGNYFGICQCENCQKKYRDYSGLPLPENEDKNIPGYEKYESFRKMTTDALFMTMSRTAKAVSSNIAVVNYAETGVDIYRLESNSSLGRPLPEWEYSPHENVSKIQTTWPEIKACNSSVHFLDFPFRFNAVAPALTKLRTIQTLTQGAWLDFYVLGYLDNQADRACYDSMKELYSFHKKHINDYSGYTSAADCCVICADYRRFNASRAEFRGISRILTNNQIPFDVLDQRGFLHEGISEKLSAYSLVIVSDVNLDDSHWSIINQYVVNGGKILVTGISAMTNASGRLLGVTGGEVKNAERAAYWEITSKDHNKLPLLNNLHLLFLDSSYMTCRVNQNAEVYLGKLETSTFGPPEKCFKGKETEIPGVVCTSAGKGRTVYIPWPIGQHYEKRSYHGHASLIRSLLIDHLQYKPVISGLHPLIQVFLRKKEKELQISLINHSGQSGTDFFPPLVIKNLNFQLNSEFDFKEIRCLRGNRAEMRKKKDTLQIQLDNLGDFETLILKRT